MIPRTRAPRLLAGCIAALVHAGIAHAVDLPCSSLTTDPPPTISALLSRQVQGILGAVVPHGTNRGLETAIGSFRVAKLEEHFWMASPARARQEQRPVLIAIHGFVPVPVNYARTAKGAYERPAREYRSIMEAYASRGFIVLVPDFRGHANSQGASFTGCYLSSSYYTEDVLALASLVSSLPGADPSNVFLWGHSLGGEVALRALITSASIRGAALWDSVGDTIWQQAYYYSRYQEPMASDDSQRSKDDVAQIKREIAAAGPSFDWAAREPSLHLDQLAASLIIHHSIHDTVADYGWSRHLAAALYAGDHPYQFWTYPGTDHLLSGQAREDAIDRDVRFFRSLMRGNR